MDGFDSPSRPPSPFIHLKLEREIEREFERENERDHAEAATVKEQVEVTSSGGFGRWLFSLLRSIILVLLSPFHSMIVGSKKEAEIAQAIRTLSTATTYASFCGAAASLDSLTGGHEWRNTFASPLYSAAVVADRTAHVRATLATHDDSAVATALRIGLLRNLGGLGNAELFGVAISGTKQVVTEYIDTVLEALEVVGSSRQLSVTDRLAFFRQTRQSFGRTALCLSGGAAFGLFHLGVLRALHAQDQLPRVISGSSVGALVGAAVCVLEDNELERLFTDPAAVIRLDPFDRLTDLGASRSVRRGSGGGKVAGGWSSEEEDVAGGVKAVGDGDDTWPDADLAETETSERLIAYFSRFTSRSASLRRFIRLASRGHLMDVNKLLEVARVNYGDVTFAEAFERTGRVLNITVNSPSEPPRLLNYLTAPDVLIWSAAAASCALAGLYAPIELQRRDPVTGRIVPYTPSKLMWSDGSMETDLPMQRLAELFNVNHFIVSQVNPHVVPLIAATTTTAPGRLVVPLWRRALRTIVRASLAEVGLRTLQLAEVGLLPSFLEWIPLLLKQHYTGNITITPSLTLRDYGYLLANPTPDRLRECMQRGEWATWTKMVQIKVHTSIERALERGVELLKQEAVKERAAAAAAAGLRRSRVVAAAAAAASDLDDEDDDVASFSPVHVDVTAVDDDDDTATATDDEEVTFSTDLL